MSKEIMIRYWMEKAHEDLASARSNFLSDRSQNSVTPHHVESWLNGKNAALEPKRQRFAVSISPHRKKAFGAMMHRSMLR